MIYINGIGCVSPQVGFDDLLQKEEEINQSEPLLSLAPNYSQYLEPNAARRLSKVIKNSWCATADALKQAAVQQVDEIISATAMGCLADTTTFLNRIKDFPEVVSPTAFIQSTHNTIAGFAALQLKCYGLNKTIAQRNFSFEHALLDAQINTEKNGNVLLIAYDELNSELATIFNKIATQTNSKIKFGEASVATVLAGEQSEKNLCKLITVGTITGKKTEDLSLIHI